MTIDHEAGTPPYRQLAAILRDRIGAGEITGMLPSERYLAQEHAVAMSTVRRALALLREEGLIVTAPGWGSSVNRGTSPPPQA
jgi:GntR family transcriptional regulator